MLYKQFPAATYEQMFNELVPQIIPDVYSHSFIVARSESPRYWIVEVLVGLGVVGCSRCR